MPKDAPQLRDCKFSLTQAYLLPLAFTLAFSVFAYCHCRWARGPFISAALAYNLIKRVLYAPMDDDPGEPKLPGHLSCGGEL